MTTICESARHGAWKIRGGYRSRSRNYVFRYFRKILFRLAIKLQDFAALLGIKCHDSAANPKTPTQLRPEARVGMICLLSGSKATSNGLAKHC
jgi:hypothetical protein